MCISTNIVLVLQDAALLSCFPLHLVHCLGPLWSCFLDYESGTVLEGGLFIKAEPFFDLMRQIPQVFVV